MKLLFPLAARIIGRHVYSSGGDVFGGMGGGDGEPGCSGGGGVAEGVISSPRRALTVVNDINS